MMRMLVLPLLVGLAAGARIHADLPRRRGEERRRRTDEERRRRTDEERRRRTEDVDERRRRTEDVPRRRAPKLGATFAEAWSPGCKHFMETSNCGWTESWNCPGQRAGKVGKAMDDGKTPFRCCCREKGWRTAISATNFVSADAKLKQPVHVTFVVRAGPAPLCMLHRPEKPISIFLKHAFHHLRNEDRLEFTYDPKKMLLGFGVQDNAWYWRPGHPKPHEQDPDNAGMQVFLDKNCKTTTGPSIAGGSVPDARKVLSVRGQPDGAGRCKVYVERPSKQGLCVAGAGSKQCCGPCSLNLWGSYCCERKRHGHQMTC